VIQLSFEGKSIIALSDTHGKHGELKIPPCDILIHCGDICTDGDENQISDFFDWFSASPAKYKLFVSGNHDYPFVFEPLRAINLIPLNIIFMENRIKTIQNISFLGLTSQDNLHGIPDIQTKKVDFLLTHVPPKSILDDDSGCPYLSEFVSILNPRFHIFGHIHQFGGKKLRKGNTVFINASCIKTDYP